MPSVPISRRAYGKLCTATSWEELWEAGSYYDRVAEIMEDARHSVIIVGWQIDSRLPMKLPHRPNATLGPDRETLKRKIIRLCESNPDLHIYLLMWDHAWFYIYEREVWQGRIWENIHPRVHFIFDNRHPLGASHHEKLVMVDGRTALCGGIDLCDERWDTPTHLHHDFRRSLTMRQEHHGPYHDLAVQVTGPICLELHRHIAERWEHLSAVPFPKAPKYGDTIGGHAIYVSRTLARIDLERGRPHVLREIEFLYRDLIEHAKKRLILEGQYYWSEEFNDLLIRKIRQVRGTDFEITLVLADLRHVKSLTRVMTQYELRLLDRLVTAAKNYDVKLVVGMPYSYDESDDPAIQKHRARPVYVHSKVMIVDDSYLSIGSANFAARALRLDSEVNLTFEARNEAERRHIERFSARLLAHWNTHSVELRRLNPALLLHHNRGANRWIEPPSPDFTWVAWERFFDPEMSPLYPLKRWLTRWNFDRNPLLRSLGKSALTAAAAGLALWIAGVSSIQAPDALLRSILYAYLLCAVWAVPVPFLPLALFAAIDTNLDPNFAIRLPIAAFWIASIFGYFGTRMFPTRANLLYQSLKGSTLAQRLGERFFPRLLVAAFDPAVPLHYKIAYEGIYCLPLPWFGLVNGLLLPAALFGILSAWQWAWFAIAPRRVFEIVSELALPWMVIMIAITVIRAVRRSRHSLAVKKSDAEKTQNSFLQHS